MADWIPRPPNLSDKLVDWQALSTCGGNKLIEGLDVLDIGAEWGVDAFTLSPLARSYVAADKSIECIGHLKLMAMASNVCVHSQDAAHLTYPDNSFDTVLDFSALDDSEDPRAGYLEALRVLRPGGHMLSSYANEDVCGPGNYHGQRPTDFVDWCRRVGFRVLRRLNESSPRSVIFLQKVPPMVTMDQARAAWTRAADFPANKEDHYPNHAAAHGFDGVSGKKVLEYGCGGGSDAMSLLRRGAEVWYSDIVPTNVTTATARIRIAKLEEKSHPLTLDHNDRIPLESETLDMVTSHGVLHHIEDPLPVLKEMRRILKPGGLLYVMLYTHEYLRARFDSEVSRLVREHHISPDEAFGWCTDGQGTPYAKGYTQDEGTQLLALAGFQVIGMTVYGGPGESSRDFRTFKAVRL